MAIPAPLFMKRKPRQALVTNPPLSQSDAEFPRNEGFPTGSWTGFMPNAKQYNSYNDSRSFLLPPIHQQLRFPSTAEGINTPSKPVPTESFRSLPGFLPNPTAVPRYATGAGNQRINQPRLHYPLSADVAPAFSPSTPALGHTSVRQLGSYGSSFGLDKQPQKTMSASASTPSDILRKSLPFKPQGQVLETVKKEPEFTFQKESKSMFATENMTGGKRMKTMSPVPSPWQPDDSKVAVRTPGSASLTPVKKTDKKKEMDHSLRVLTATVEGMKHWSQYQATLPMLFEIIGSLNSAVTLDDKRMFKRFQLRDDKDTVACLFCEIDRELPKLNRGQWYRCMGTYDRGLGVFRCVSVRLATDSEKMFRHNMVQACDRAMRLWITSELRR